MRTVLLRDEISGLDRRHLAARVDAGGSLRIEGQDLGPSVEEFLGMREYEWAHTVKPEHLPTLCAALGGAPDADVLDLLATWCRQNDPARLGALFAEHDIPAQFWSRVGD